VERLSLEARKAALKELSGWTGTEGREAIAKTFAFKDFNEAFGFMCRVALVAEKRDHHPDILLGWGRAEVTWSTHDAGGITTLDTSMAETTDKLYGSQV